MNGIKKTLILECQLINLNRIMKLEYHHLATTMITVSGKDHQWILNEGEKVWCQTGYLHIGKVSPKRYLTNYKGKKSNLTMLNLADATLNKWSKFIPSINLGSRYHEPPERMP